MISVHKIHISSSGEIPNLLSEINSGFVSGLYSGVFQSLYLENHISREYNRKAQSFGLHNYMMTGASGDFRCRNYYFSGDGGGPTPETNFIVQIGGDQIVQIGGDNINIIV